MKHPWLRKLRFPTVAVALALATPSVGGIGASAPAPECRVAQEWVASHKTKLPTTAEELKQYPTAYRRAIFGPMSREQRTQFWLTHLKQSTDRDASEWTETQLQVVRDVEALIRNGHFLGADTDDGKALIRRIEQAFSTDDALELFTLDWEQSLPTTALAASATASHVWRRVVVSMNRVRDAVEPALRAEVDCNCNSQAWCNFIGQEKCCERYFGEYCVIAQACGWTGNDWCYGVCAPAANCWD